MRSLCLCVVDGLFSRQQIGYEQTGPSNWEDAATRDAEAVAEQRAEEQAKDRQVGAILMAENALDNLYFDHKLTGDTAYRPERVATTDADLGG